MKKKSVFFIAFFILCTYIMGTKKIYADDVIKPQNVKKPQIIVSLINKKTGVKIKIGKTSGADSFRIYMSSKDTIYDNYKSSLEQEIAILDEDGSEERTYVISGLPKGEYTFRVCAMQSVYLPATRSAVKGINVLMHAKYSDPVTITIKGIKKSETKKTYDFSECKKGDIVTFGRYEQDALMTNGPEDIEWIVLSKKKNEMLLLSKYVLDCLSYNVKASCIIKKCR